MQSAEWMITFREDHEWVVVLAEAGTHFDFARPQFGFPLSRE
jgi:hypothetical protein